MDIVELQILVEEDGIGFSLDNELIDIDSIEDVELADMMYEAKLLLDAINTYINEKVEEIREDNEEDCDCY